MLSLKSIEETNKKVEKFLTEQINKSEVAQFPITNGNDSCCDGEDYLRFFDDCEHHSTPIYVHADPISIAYYLIHGNQDGWDWLYNDQAIMREFILTAENPWSVVHFDSHYREHEIAHGVPEYMQEYKDQWPETIQFYKSHWYRKEHDYVG